MAYFSLHLLFISRFKNDPLLSEQWVFYGSLLTVLMPFLTILLPQINVVSQHSKSMAMIIIVIGSVLL
ncbi:hypothetical protein AOC03_07540 [Psychrobacter urativorans]|uniref:Uncharacterized protein n=1 Tax=Psychrobacter urativorans TaxID=45610 RepID=A0A0M4TVJ0_9GAMM|nr:hypothetical protein AOC03_07540 [Psychrobacter urativorans]